jgi:predicted nuclease with TOPRIM domain
MKLEQEAHERAIALERDATRLKKRRHFKLIRFCSMLGAHVDWLNGRSERLNEENKRLQEEVQDGFRFESNMDDLEDPVERKETRLLNEFNVIKQVVQVRPHSNRTHGGGKSLT